MTNGELRLKVQEKLANAKFNKPSKKDILRTFLECIGFGFVTLVVGLFFDDEESD